MDFETQLEYTILMRQTNAVQKFPAPASGGGGAVMTAASGGGGGN